MLNLYRIRGRFGSDIVNLPTKVEPPQHEPIEEETYQGNRTEVPKKVPVTDSGQRSNQDVLRVAGDGRGASDV